MGALQALQGKKSGAVTFGEAPELVTLTLSPLTVGMLVDFCQILMERRLRSLNTAFANAGVDPELAREKFLDLAHYFDESSPISIMLQESERVDAIAISLYLRAKPNHPDLTLDECLGIPSGELVSKLDDIYPPGAGLGGEKSRAAAHLPEGMEGEGGPPDPKPQSGDSSG